MINRIKIFQSILDTITFNELSPVDNIGNEYDLLLEQGPTNNKQLIANPRKEYVAFFWGAPSSPVHSAKIQAPSGSYSFRWYKPDTGEVIGTGISSSNGILEINSPSSWNEGAGLALVVKNLNLNVAKIRIDNGWDDSEEFSSGNIDRESSDIELVFDSSSGRGNQVIGLRFNQVNIPNGGIILNAYIQFEVDEINNTAGEMTIHGEASNSSQSFSPTIGNISQREKTGASMQWIPALWNQMGEIGTKQRTPDLSHIVQQIVNRNGWSSGNSMSFIISGSGQRVARSYDGDPSGGALLFCEYSAPLSAPSNLKILADIQ